MEVTLELLKYLQPQRRVVFPLYTNWQPCDGKTLCKSVLSNEANVQDTKKWRN